MASQHLLVIFIAGSLVLTLFGLFLIVYVIAQKNKQNLFARELLKTEVRVNEQTMDKVSLEIHDNIVQQLFGVQLQINTLAITSKDGNDQLRASAEGVSNIISQLRNLSHLLNSDQIKKLGLERSLERELTQPHVAQKLVGRLTTEGEPRSVESDKALMLFRLAQEAITNALKHADASRLDVKLIFGTGKLVMKIEDDGKGFDPSHLSVQQGIGIANMQQRAKVLGGVLDIVSAPGRGCKLSVSVSA